MRRVVFHPDKSQEVGITHFLKKSFAGLFWPPGLGKTAVVLFAFWCLRKRKMARRMLVISKVKIVTNVWPREIEKWDFCEGITYAVCRGEERRRIEALESGADIVLLNMENTEWFVDLVMGCREKVLRGHKKVWVTHPPERPDLLARFDVLCIDESSKFRNHNTKRFEAISRVLPSFKRRYILTGSPAPKGLMNLWAQMYIVDRGESLGRYITHFRHKYFTPVGPKKWSQWVLKTGVEKKIYKAISKRILRIGDGVMKMPPLPPPVNRIVPLSEEERRIYDQLERKSILELAGKVITVENGGVMTVKLRQIANGRVYLRREDGKRDVVRIHDAKAEEVLNLIEEMQGTPALVGYETHADLEALQDVLRDSRFSIGVIKGGMSDKATNEVIDRWNQGEIDVLLAQYDVVSHGLNMQDTHASVIYYGIPWDLETYEQFYRRVWRRGQKKTVMRYHVLAEDTVDDLVCLPGIMAKDKQQQTMLDELEKFMKRRKKFERPQSLVRMGEKAGMEALKTVMQSSRQRVPKVRLDVEDPGGVLLSSVHKCAKEWAEEKRVDFVARCSGVKPEEVKPEDATDEVVKSMIDEIFGVDQWKVIPPSRYKLWPGGTSRGRPEKEEVMPSSSELMKKARAKKKTAKKTSAKKTSAKKTSAKKTSAKKAGAEKVVVPPSLDGALVAVKDAKKPIMPVRQKLVKKVADAKGRGIKTEDLLVWMEKHLGVKGKRAAQHVSACIRNKFIEKK